MMQHYSYLQSPNITLTVTAFQFNKQFTALNPKTYFNQTYSNVDIYYSCTNMYMIITVEDNQF